MRREGKEQIKNNLRPASCCEGRDQKVQFIIFNTNNSIMVMTTDSDPIVQGTLQTHGSKQSLQQAANSQIKLSFCSLIKEVQTSLPL